MTTLKEHIQGLVTFQDYHDGDKIVKCLPDGKEFAKYIDGRIHIKDGASDQEYVEVSSKKGSLIYRTSTGIDFHVPITDIGNATFLDKDKGILFMRYIRKAIK